MVEYEIEDFELEDAGDYKILNLPELSEEEIKIIDPIVAPTSGLRIQIFDIQERDGKDFYLLTRRKLFLFLRVFKAISIKYKELNQNRNFKILIVTDNRPSRHILLKYCSQIFAFDNFEIYYQKDLSGESRLSSPYGAASVALLENINLIIVLTASHNDLSWNGIKFYINYPIPISGDIFEDISKKAIALKKIDLKSDYKTKIIDAENKNNEYVRKLLSHIIDVKSLKGKNIVIWPYLGKARGIVNLFKSYGANVILIEEEINPPNPIKEIREDKLQLVMEKNQSNLALLLDADRDRIALYVKQNGKYIIYIPNEIYSAMHNILAKDFNREIINVRTIPSDLRGDETSFLNILTGVGYKHLGVILYFLLGIEVDQSKIDTAILYFEKDNRELIKLDNPTPLKEQIIKLMEKEGLIDQDFLIVMWEESGGHTINILNIRKTKSGDFIFNTDLPVIADKYPVPALVIAAELVARGYVISESIDWSIVGINQTIPAVDEVKVKIMENFKMNDGKILKIGNKEYEINALSDNNNDIDIYQLKSNDSTLYFRPSGTGPEIRFYIFGKRETHLEEIKRIQDFVKKNYS
jgi:phosphomannomutase